MGAVTFGTSIVTDISHVYLHEYFSDSHAGVPQCNTNTCSLSVTVKTDALEQETSHVGIYHLLRLSGTSSRFIICPTTLHTPTLTYIHMHVLHVHVRQQLLHNLSKYP